MTDDSADRWEDPDEPFPVAGKRFRDFEIWRDLGTGAHSRVYLVRDLTLGGRPAVIKVSPYGIGDDTALSLLEHPNVAVVTACEYDAATGLTVLATPYHGGGTIRYLIEYLFRRGRPPTDASDLLDAARALTVLEGLGAHQRTEVASRVMRHGSYVEGVVQLADQLCQALQHTHENGVSHGALHASNVLVTISGRVVLLDFTRPTPPVDSWPEPESLPYLPPEALRARLTSAPRTIRGFDPRGDLYAVGVLLFELLTGHPPRPSPTGLAGEALLRSQLAAMKPPPPSIRAENPAVSKCLERSILRCLAADPADRPESARALREELQAFYGPRERIKRWGWRNRGPLSAAAVAGLVSLAFLVGWWRSLPPWQERAMEQARGAVSREDHAGAIALLNPVIRDGYSAEEAYLLRGASYWWGGVPLDPTRSLGAADLNKSIAIRPSAAAHWLLACSLTATKTAPMAREHFQAAVQLEPDWIPLRLTFGSFLLTTGSAADAQRCREQADAVIRIAPHDARPWLLRAWAHLESANAESADGKSAVRELDQALQVEPNSRTVRILVAEVYAHMIANHGHSSEEGAARIRTLLEQAVEQGASATALREIASTAQWHPHPPWLVELIRKAAPAGAEVDAHAIQRLYLDHTPLRERLARRRW